MNLRVASLVQGAQGACEDRAEVIQTAVGTVIVVADGAGGMGGGAGAAEAVVNTFRARHPTVTAITTTGYGAEALLELDDELSAEPAGGQTTAVVLAIGQGLIVGASVGDSEAWLISNRGYRALTAAQARTPLIGSGGAVPRAFKTSAMPCRLLVATDGLFRYASPESVCGAARTPELDRATAALLDAVRLPSGALQDDVALVLCDLSV